MQHTNPPTGSTYAAGLCTVSVVHSTYIHTAHVYCQSTLHQWNLLSKQ